MTKTTVRVGSAKRKYTRKKFNGGEPISLLTLALLSKHHATHPHVYSAFYTPKMHAAINHGAHTGAHVGAHVNIAQSVSGLIANVGTYAIDLSEPIVRFSLLLKAHKMLNKVGDYEDFKNNILKEVTFTIIGILLMDVADDEHIYAINDALRAYLSKETVESFINQVADKIGTGLDGNLLKDYETKIKAMPEAISKLAKDVVKTVEEFLMVTLKAISKTSSKKSSKMRKSKKSDVNKKNRKKKSEDLETVIDSPLKNN